MAPAERPARAAVVATAAGTAVAAVGILSILAAFADASSPAWGGTPAPVVWAVIGAVLVAQSAVVLWRRRIADAAWLVAAALPLAVTVAAPTELFSLTAFPVLVASFLAGVSASLRHLRGWAVGAGILVAVGQFLNAFGLGRADYGGMALEAAAQGLIVVGVPLLPATVIHAQRATRRAQQTALEALTRERDAQIGEAIARERAAMARELHDIAAHHLSGIALMASAIDGQVESDPAGAREGARQIRRQSRETLEDLRRLVGLLRDAGEGDQAVKTLATIGEVVPTAEAAGATVQLDVRAPASGVLGDGISALGQLTAYRMVQEALTNALRHAPGGACVVLVDDSGPAALVVSVRNDAPAPGVGAGTGSGLGIVGMTERAALIGAEFAAGPTVDGGWDARMTIPREPGRPAEGGTP